MGEGVRVTELYGIGTKYEIGCGGQQRLAVIVHKDGTRELYAFERGGQGEPSAVIRLEDDEARKLAAVLSGTFFGGD
jgi:K+/H+ antiporter YhaU regulatory subunit KhtT